MTVIAIFAGSGALVAGWLMDAASTWARMLFTVGSVSGTQPVFQKSYS
ncbi:MAG TPA: hypothetical protein VFY81_08000 [Gammaproteobacteria bacterium]|nr:hypothetical protein [Gammaproteobacteria bacterium]